MGTARQGLENWHRVIDNGSKAEELAQILDENAVFHSPVVHTPQKGRPLVMAYLGAAGETLGNEQFRYVREVVDGDIAVLEFVSEIDGIHINGIDIITFNADGKIIDFKVMVRPLKAINKVWEMMARQLERMKAE